MLLYVGAGTDIRPVTRYAHTHKDFIYVDGLPDRPSSWGVTAKHIQAALVRELHKENAFDRLDSIDDDTFQITLSGGGRILYFMNVLDSEVHLNSKVSPYFKQADTLYMNGFIPKFQEHPPNLQLILGTYICFRGIRFQDWIRPRSTTLVHMLNTPLYDTPLGHLHHLEGFTEQGPATENITYQVFCQKCEGLTPVVLD